MAYTIRIGAPDENTVYRIITALHVATNMSRFSAAYNGPTFVPATRKHPALWDVTVRPVRLFEAKPYCGQHPGECLLDRKRPSSRLLEWDDWVEFHGLVNDVLDAAHIKADVWSNPAEPLSSGKKMWIRRDNKRRVRFDYDVDTRPGRMFQDRIWNAGTPDQFEESTHEA
jgi:hypothetical protein